MARLKGRSFAIGLLLFLLSYLRYLAPAYSAAAAGGAAGVAHPPYDLLSACKDAESCPVMSEEPPETFDVVFATTAGEFTVRAVTSWAPPFVRRLWVLSRLRYMEGAPFYRVDRISATKSWVVQFGYSGEPSVDQCWDQLQTSNETWSVHPPGNVRGTVAFSMDAVQATGANPNCTAEDYCAQGFSTNVYINYANNSRLDQHGFAIVGFVLETGMDVVDRLYAGYGEVCDLCPADGSGRHYDEFCKGFGHACQGVNMTRLVQEGETYLSREKPLLDRILSISVKTPTALVV
mmetsp:Transcript_74613/g.207392  ORF Transcript_74613/g.207392 Transcript_74613/m.207392 type:complete len:291 (+) Transcript_74613:31-903(+)